MLSMSAAPPAASSAADSQNRRDSANAIIDSPNSATAVSSVNAGSVTYASYGTSLTRYADGTTNVYTYNYSSEYTTGPLLAPMPATLGNHVDVYGAFTDALNQHAEATVGVDLYPFTPITYDYGPFCFSYDYSSDDWGHIVSSYCAHPVTVEHGTEGATSGVVQQ